MYEIKFYQGDYGERQRQANEDECVAYVEHHFNSASSSSAGYSVVITGSNASQTSKNWGRWYANAVGREFDVPVSGDNGIVVGGYGGRGDSNLRYTNMPAILLEPLFASNPQHAEWIRSDDGQTRLAQALCDSIERFFPEGGRIGFSVGHKYKSSRPTDCGAQVCGGGVEAEFAEEVLLKAKEMLMGIHAPTEERKIKVMRGSEVLWSQAVDEDADLVWDSVRGVLRIHES